MIKRQPALLSDAQRTKIKNLVKTLNLPLEDLVCTTSCYRTTSIDKLYKYEAVKLIDTLNDKANKNGNS